MKRLLPTALLGLFLAVTLTRIRSTRRACPTGERRGEAATTSGRSTTPPDLRGETSAPRRGRLTALLAPLMVVLAVAVASIGVTYAAWSDHATTGTNRVGAGALVIAGDDELEVTLPTAGSAEIAELEVSTAGTSPAELGLALALIDQPDGLCHGYEHTVHGGELQLHLEATDATGDLITYPAGDLCAAGLTAIPWPGIDTLTPGVLDQVAVGLRVELVEDAFFRWSGKQAVFDLQMTGDQPGGGFSDSTTVRFTVTVGDYLPATELAPECPGDVGAYRSVHDLGDGSATLDLDAAGTRGPVYITGGSGPKTVYGTPQDDCMVFRDGEVELFGLEGDDTLVAGDGAIRLDGGPGDDVLIAGSGGAHLDGGPGIDTCEAVEPATVTGCEAGTASDLMLEPMMAPSLVPEEGSRDLLPPPPADKDEDVPPADGAMQVPSDDDLTATEDEDGRTSPGPTRADDPQPPGDAEGAAAGEQTHGSSAGTG